MRKKNKDIMVCNPTIGIFFCCYRTSEHTEV